MRWLVVAMSLACAKPVPLAPSMDYDHELAAPGVSTLIRQAADRIDAGDYAGAEALLREVLPEPVDPELASRDLLAQAMTAFELGDLDGATVLLGQIVRDYPYTRAATVARSKVEELAVVGSTVASLDGVEWLQGEANWGTGTTLVVFWEAWCPHCQREVPQLEAYHNGIEGLGVVGLTKLTRGVEPQQAKDFLAAGGVTFANGVEDGELSAAFSVTGIPAAAVVRDGVVVWRGHPAMLDAQHLTDMVAGR